jgi:hypothetical protein
MLDATAESNAEPSSFSSRAAATFSLLTAKARDLFAQPPTIKEVDVLAAKLPQ